MKEKPKLRLGSIKADILNLQILVSDMKRANRMRLAAIIDRECALSRRRHELDSTDLTSRLHSNSESDIIEAESVIQHAQRKLSRVREKIALLEDEEQQIDEKMRLIEIPNLASLQTAITQKKSDLNNNTENVAQLTIAITNCDSQRNELESLINSLTTQLEDLDSKILEKRVFLETPIDDLQLQQIAVESVEQSIPPDPPDSLTSSELAFNLEMEEMTQMETRNKERMQDIQTRRTKLIHHSMSPIVVRIPKRAATPSVRRDPLTIQCDSYLSQINSSIEAMKKRQADIEVIERDTIALQASYTEDQKQIEDSWSYKIDDLRTLQQRNDENEDLEIQIDEAKDAIMELTDAYLEIHTRLEKKRGQREVVAKRLNSLCELHPKMESRVVELIDRKRTIEQRERQLSARKSEIDRFSAEVDELGERYREYKRMVDDLEQKVENARQGNIGAMTQVVKKPREHVRFVQNFNSIKPTFQYQTPVRTRRLDSTSMGRRFAESPAPARHEPRNESLTYEEIEEEEEESFGEAEVVQIASSNFPSLDDFTNDNAVPKPESFDDFEEESVGEDVNEYNRNTSSEYESYHEKRRLVFPVFTGEKKPQIDEDEDDVDDEEPRQTYFRTEQKSFYGVGTIIPRRTQNVSTSGLSETFDDEDFDVEDDIDDVVTAAIQAIVMPLETPSVRIPD